MNKLLPVSTAIPVNPPDYEKLAASTSGFVASDIVFVVDEAARYALRNNGKIEQNVLEEIIYNTRPSLSKEQLVHYESIKDKLEGTTKSK